jgi:hypothetical protein
VNDFGDPKALTVDHVTLDWIRVQATNEVAPEFAQSVRPDVFRGDVWGRLVHQLKAYVLAEHLPPEREVAEKTYRFWVPASPWQQFKLAHAERWWLRWLTRRRPARQVEHVFHASLVVDLKRYHTFPKARITHDEMLGRSVNVAIWTREVCWGRRVMNSRVRHSIAATILLLGLLMLALGLAGGHHVELWRPVP